MRLEGRIKMGYYPTPLSVVDRIRSFVRFPEDNVSLLDPCCGEGLALKHLTGDDKATTYGIELDEYRAEQAKERLCHVLKGSYTDARISNNVSVACDENFFLSLDFCMISSPNGISKSQLVALDRFPLHLVNRVFLGIVSQFLGGGLDGIDLQLIG